ncbi:MAG: hypothetical protein KDC71_07125 [Acidobacteria bacterium]|nr:hypothetical protein [Acidobacteriota bacterium]
MLLPLSLLLVQFPFDSLDSLPLRHWTTAEGLPQNGVNAIEQDELGYLYLGTQEGLVRFDGSALTTYSRFNTPQFDTNYIYCMLKTASGALVVGTRRGLYHFDHGQISLDPSGYREKVQSMQWAPDGSLLLRSDNRLVHIIANTVQDLGEWPRLNAFLCDQSGSLWAATHSGLFRASRMDAAWESISDQAYDYLFQDHEGHIWACSKNRLDSLSKPVSLQLAEDPNLLVTAMAETANGLALASSAGLFLVRDQTVQRGFREKFLISVFNDRAGHLWFGENANGLFQLKPGNIRNYRADRGLSSNNINGLFVEPERIWVVSPNGLDIIDQNGQIQPFPIPPNSSGLTTLYRDPTGKIWLGSRSHGLSFWTGSEWQVFQRPNGENVPRPRSFFTDSQNQVWVSSDLLGLVLLSDNAQTVWNLGGVGNVLFGLAEDQPGRFWGASDQGLLAIEDGKAQNVSRQWGVPHACLGVLPDPDGGLWLNFELSGLSYWRDGHLSQISIHEGLPYDTNFNLQLDKNGRLWMGSNLCIFSISRESALNRFQNKQAPLDLWVFRQQDGLASGECNLIGNQSVGMSADRVFFASVGGLVSIQTQKPEMKEPPPQVVLENFRVNGQDFSLDGPTEIGPKVDRLEFLFCTPNLSNASANEYSYRISGLEDNWSPPTTQRSATYTHLPPGHYTFEVKGRYSNGEWSNQTASHAMTIRPTLWQNPVFRGLALALLVLLFSAVPLLRVQILKQRKRELQTLVRERTHDLAEANTALMRTQNQLVQAAHEAGMAEMAVDVLHSIGNALNSLNVSACVLRDNLSAITPPYFPKIAEPLPQDIDQQNMFLLSDAGRKWLKGLLRLLDQVSERKQLAQNECSELIDHVENLKKVLQAQQAHLRTHRLIEDIDLVSLIQNQIKIHQPQWDAHQIELSLNIEELPTLRGHSGKLTQIISTLLKNAFDALADQPIRKIEILGHASEDQVEVTICDSGCGIASEKLDWIFNHGTSTKPGSFGTGLHYSALMAKELGGCLCANSSGPGQGASFTLKLPIHADYHEKVS